MHAAPKPPDEQQRLADLLLLDALDTAPDAALERLVRLAAQQLGAPMAAITLVDAERQWLKARYGLAITETPRSYAFCAHAILGNGPTIVPDARTDERFHDNPMVRGGPSIRFYAAAPLILSTGSKVGALCVADTQSRAGISEADRVTLQNLAAIAVDFMELRRDARIAARDAQAAATDHERRNVNARVAHDLRTPLNGLLGFLALARRGVTDGERVETLDGALAAGRALRDAINAIVDPQAVSNAQAPNIGARAGRLLIAEDHGANRLMLKKILESAGYSVDAVENGAEAVAALKERPYDAILLDNKMPVMAGVTAARLIRSLHNGRGQTPLVAVSASSLASETAEMMAAGFDAFVAKPAMPEEIFAAIDRAIASRAWELLRVG
ncbi:MAG: response regulator [Hyphomonadaceae bacterium]